MGVAKNIGRACMALMASSVILFSQTTLAQNVNSAYWQWWELTGGAKGNFVSNGVWNDLAKAPITGSNGAWTLKPNTSLCQDNIDSNDAGGITYWCTDKKWVEMKTYEQTTVTAGAPSKATFNGCFGPATGMTSSTVSAFVWIGSTTYQQFAFESSSSACWNFELDILGDVDVIVQKGFIVDGPNADPRDGDPGSIIAYEGATVAPGYSQFAPGIPALPLGGLLGLIALVGWMGMRRR